MKLVKTIWIFEPVTCVHCQMQIPRGVRAYVRFAPAEQIVCSLDCLGRLQEEVA